MLLPVADKQPREGRMERDLTFSDWPMFDRVMRNPGVCRQFLQVVLGIEVGRLDYVDVEKSLLPDIEAKSVRLDVFAKDSERIFDVEMQASPKSALGRRLRYYQAAMDVTSTSAGARYEDLPESHIIFLCSYDPFGKAIPCYTFGMRCSQDASADPGCGFTWTVLNAKAWRHCTEPSLRSLLEYVMEGTVGDDALVRSIDGLVRQANESRTWKENAMGVMTLEHDMAVRVSAARKEGLAEGHAEGLEEGKTQGEALEARRYNALIDGLLAANRPEDLRRAAHDDAYRDRLFGEFGIA